MIGVDCRVWKVVGGRRYWKEGAWSRLQGMERLEGEGIGRNVVGVDCRGWKVVGGRRLWKEGEGRILYGMKCSWREKVLEGRRRKNIVRYER